MKFLARSFENAPLLTWTKQKSHSFPSLKTSRLFLRRLTYADAEALFSYFSEPSVTEYYDVDTLIRVEQAEELIRLWSVAYSMKKAMRWALVLKESNEVIGTCGFHNFHEEHARAEIGYDLKPAFWHQGYMREAVSSMIRYGFRRLNLHRIEAFIFPQNIASRKLLEAVGLQFEGRLQEYFWHRGEFVDSEIYAITYSRWKKK